MAPPNQRNNQTGNQAGNQTPTDLSPPDLTVDNTKLTAAGFTSTGIQRFKQTLNAYSLELFTKSILYGDTEKVEGFEREVTQEHVRKGASSLATRAVKKNKRPNWVIPCQIGEYAGIAIASAGASNLDKDWGTLAFGLGLALGVILFAIRISNENKNEG